MFGRFYVRMHNPRVAEMCCSGRVGERAVHRSRGLFANGAASLVAALVLLSLGAGNPPPAHAESVDLKTDTNVRIDGARERDEVGNTVAPVGDLNGDRMSDAVVAAKGSAYVVYGRRDRASIDLAQGSEGGRGFRLRAPAEADRDQLNAAGAGDVNGDGYSDLLVSWSQADYNGRANSGSTWVVFGGPTATDLDLTSLGDRGFRIDGGPVVDMPWISTGGNGVLVRADCVDQAGITSDGAGLGATVAGQSDANGDGLDDVVVASRGGGDCGSFVYVVFGKRTTANVDVANMGVGGFVIEHSADDVAGSAPGNDQLSTAALVGDMSNDRRAEIALGTRGASNNSRVSSGSAHVVFGKGTDTPVSLASLGLGGFRIDGADAYARFGGSVSRAGDINRDGREDLIAGATYGITRYGGKAYVIFGKADPNAIDLLATPLNGFRIDGESVDDEFASSVAGAGDVDGDGISDVIIGAPRGRSTSLLDPSTRTGAAYVIRGSSGPEPVQIKDLGARGHKVIAAGSDRAGTSVAGAGDANADGRADVLVGAPIAGNNGRSSSGSAHVVDGLPPRPKLTLSGRLYDDYRPGGRYAREALYDSDYVVDVKAQSGGAEPQSGVVKLEFRVDGQVRPADTRAQPCVLGSCPLSSSFRLFTDEYPDGRHTVSIVATDQAGRTTEVAWRVIIDRRGDIYTAEEQAGPVPDFDPGLSNEREWGRIDTHDARKQDEEWIATRTTRQDGENRYDEVRRVSRLSDDRNPETGKPYPDQEEAWTVKRGKSPDDPDLPIVASILEPKKTFEAAEPAATGPIHEALTGDQLPPPAYGPTYELHEREVEIEAEDRSTSKGRTRVWIDGRTRMPIKQVVTREGGEHYGSAFWNYHHSRFERSERSDDFFSIGKPDNTGMEKEEQDNGLAPLNHVLDEETNALFPPYFVGETVTLSTGPYVLADTKILRHRVSARVAAGAGDSDLLPEDEAPAGRGEPFTNFTALYQPNPDGLTGFRPGLLSAGAPLTVRSMAKDSSQARIWRDTYVEQGSRTEIARSPGSLGLADGGVVAYLVTVSPGRTSALLDTGDSTLIVQGPYAPEELGKLIDLLETL